MVALINGCQYPAAMRWDGKDGWIPEYADNHEACSGGQTMPGVLGGWRCSCPCHQEPKP